MARPIKIAYTLRIALRKNLKMYSFLVNVFPKTEKTEVPSSVIIPFRDISIIIQTNKNEKLRHIFRKTFFIQNIFSENFFLDPLGKPDPVKNCTVGNKTFTSVYVECQPGYDGGISQQFVLEIYPMEQYPEMPANNPNKIVNSHYPQFAVQNLPPGTGFNVAVYAVNEKGASERKILRLYTLKVIEQRPPGLFFY